MKTNSVTYITFGVIVDDFLSEYCVLETGTSVWTSALYEAYVSWSHEQFGPKTKGIANRKRFDKEISARFEKGKNDAGTCIYRGLRLRVDAVLPKDE